MSRNVDIIIPVFNSWDLVKTCIDSVLATRQSDRHKIILINDCSDKEVLSQLTNSYAKVPNFTITSNEINLGFTKSANLGLKASSAPMVIILNSDTVVSGGWIEKLERQLFSSPEIGIVGPLSNAASYQSIPRTEANEIEIQSLQTPVNEIVSGFTIEELNSYLEQKAPSHKFRVPLVHGFCFVVRREVIVDIGIFDDISFPSGYGEENDYCIRAVDSGWSLAWALDTYIFHEKSGSYNLDKRRSLVESGSKVLKEKHGSDRMKNIVMSLKVSAREVQNLLF